MPAVLKLADDDATAALGARIAAALRPGDVVLLEGDLGAGKTALARAIIRSLLADPGLDVPSPTFALVQPYEGNGHLVMHTDLYRLASERDVDELGLFDRPEAILLVEWPERVPELFRKATGTVTLAVPPGGAGRTVYVSFTDDRAI